MEQQRWFDHLSQEDLAFLRRFLLCSGSLKALATEYEISYPTVRLRLDRLIEKVKAVDAATAASEFETALRGLYAESRLDQDAFRVLLDAYTREEKARKEKS